MKRLSHYVESVAAILLAVIWISPLLFAFWAAFHSTSDAVNFNLMSSWTLDNFRVAWDGAPWLQYFLNTFLLVTIVLIGQFFFTTLAGFAFAKLEFPGKNFVLFFSRKNFLF
jgi:sn-glycerol 3-phosphate transport system permease protein